MNYRSALDIILQEFYKICEIPHPSHHEEQIGAYLFQWAKDHDLIPAGMLNGFDPEAAITRQDMAALFGSFLSHYDYTAAPVNSGTPSFSDEGGIADYARDGVELCYQLGIMGGNDDGTFAPGNTAIRAEVAVTMVLMARVMGR